MRFSVVQQKEIIDSETGKFIGYIIDAEVSEETGEIIAFIISQPKKFYQFFQGEENTRKIAISHILTVGKDVAEIALNSGANDMGSIMIEENVVSSAGATTRFDAEAMQATIRRAGFTPKLRDQLYNYR